MALGYRLPGTIIEEIEVPGAANPSSTQRKPCFIGKASAYKKILYEQVTRSSTGSIDQLEQYSTGIYKILQCGTQRGLNDIVIDTDVSINFSTGSITWLTSPENNVVVGGAVGNALIASLNGTLESSVPGSDATSGYQELGLSGIVGTNSTSLNTTTDYDFQIGPSAGTLTTIVITTGATVPTYSELITLINAQLASLAPNFSASIVGEDIRFTNTITGASSTVYLQAGTTLDLFNALGVTALDTSVPGQDALPAYQEFGLTGISGTDYSPLVINTRYYFVINSKTYSVKFTSSSITYNQLITAINDVILGDNFTCSIVSGDIRISTVNTGATQTISVEDGTDISASSGQLVLTLQSPITIARSANYSQISFEANSSNYDCVIKTPSPVGTTEITVTGDASILSLIDIGTSIIVENKPKVADGGTYYVSYLINRPSTEYMVYKEFWVFEDVVDDLGDEIPENDLVVIAKLALKTYGVPRIGVVQVPPTATTSDYIDALDVIKYRDVQDVAILNSSAQCRAALRAHVEERSLPDNGRYRMGWCGAPVLTPVGDSSDLSSLRGIATTLKHERIVFVNATRAKYYYTDPTTQQEATAIVDGAFIAAAVMAYRDSFPSPTTTLLGRIVPGLEPFEEDYDDYYTEYMLQQAGSDSCFLLTDSGGVFRVVDDLTTDNSTVKRNNINIITAKDYIARDVAIQMDRTFRGSLIYNRGGYAGMIKGYLTNLFIAYLNNKIIESIGDIDVKVSSIRPDTVVIKYSYYAVYTHKYTEGYYTILL